MPLGTRAATYGGDLYLDGELIALRNKPSVGIVTNEHVASNADIVRSKLIKDAQQVVAVPLETLRVWDALASLLPATPISDDLGLVTGTFGTGVPTVQTYDMKALGTSTLRARTTIVLPPEYEDGTNVVIRLRGGALTTVAGTSMTIDAELFRYGADGLVSGADLVTTAAQTINSLSMADKDFTVTGSTLVKGDRLDLRLTLVAVDAATLTVVKGQITAVSALMDIRG